MCYAYLIAGLGMLPPLTGLPTRVGQYYDIIIYRDIEVSR